MWLGRPFFDENNWRWQVNENHLYNTKNVPEDQATEIYLGIYDVGEGEHESNNEKSGVVSATLVIFQGDVEIDKKHVVINQKSVEKSKK